MTKRIMVIFGTRPECIKMAPVIKALETHPVFEVRICNTAQHTTMVNQILTALDISPNHTLDVMTEGQTLAQTTTRVLSKLDGILHSEKPDLVLVQGDTTTTFVSSLGAYYHQIPVGHIEAGLRTYNKYSPFPEEINRRMTSALAEYHFATTALSRQNLIAEGIETNRIHVTGNTVIDCLFLALDLMEHNEIQIEGQIKRLVETNNESPIVLITAHRRESFGPGMQNIFTAIRELAHIYNDHLFIYPVHLNPNVKKPADTFLRGVPNIVLAEPLDYFSFVYLMNASHLILTDSGGIQEEAPSLGKPILVMRENTERPEGVQAGVATLTGVDSESIIAEASHLLDNTDAYQAMASKVNPYGDGTAAERIVNIIEGEIIS